LVGAVVMGVLLPLALFFLLDLHTGPQFFTLAAAIFLTWGVADLLAGILEKPRLRNRTPTGAFREEFDRRGKE
jgi:hypothetical protein